MRNKIILGTILVILFFILSELTLGLFNFKFEPPPYMKFEEHFNLCFHFNKRIFLKNPYVFWKLAPDKELGVNSFGFRDPKIISKHKDNITFRIICIGDSVTYGVPHKLNKPQNVYPKLLENLLNNANKRKKFEVINAGVSGYSSYQGLQYLKHYLLKYKPDLVIAQFGINDTAGAVYFEDKNQIVYPNWIINLHNILIKSKLYQLLSKIAFYIKIKFFKINYRDCGKSCNFLRVSPQDYRRNLEEIIKLGKKNNFKVLFIPPVCFRNGKILINMEYAPPSYAIQVNTYKLFKEKQLEASDFYATEWHFTPKGHLIIAEEIYKTLDRFGYLE